MLRNVRKLVASFAVAGFCVAGTASGADRSGNGFLTSVSELQALRTAAARGTLSSVRRSQIDKLVGIARRPWPFGDVGTRFGTIRTRTDGGSYRRCGRLNDTSLRKILTGGAGIIHAKALAYNLTGEGTFGKQARDALFAFTKSYGFDQVDGRPNYTGANACALDISTATPLLIEAAVLLESYPGWMDGHRIALQRWLSRVPHELVAAIAATRKNNWGTAAAFAGWAIAHYTRDTDLVLRTRYPVRRDYTPWRSKREHLAAQMRMIGNDWKGDSRCRDHGAQWHGGFPNELRRGSTGCNGEYLRDKDSSYVYQMKTLSHLVFHAEALKRHGDNELYRQRLHTGTPLIRRAIDFVIDNSRGRSHNWERHKMGVLRAASRSYPRDWGICKQLDMTRSVDIREGEYMPYFRVVQEDGC